MPVTLTIKQVPDQIAERLRSSAAKNHRSLQGELMSIIERAAQSQDVGKTDQGFQRMTKEDGAVNDSAQLSMNQAETDDLLADLDAIVAGTDWGKAPLLTRAQAHDRALSRELHYLAEKGKAK